MIKSGFKNKMNYKFILLFLSILFFAQTVFSGGRINVNLDYAVFYNRETGHYIELYYGFDKRGLLGFDGKNENELGEAIIAVSITKESEPVINDIWRMQIEPAADSTQTKVVDMVRFGIDPGFYKMKFYVRDVAEKSKIDSVLMEFEVADYSGEKLVLSDIELATNIKKATNGTTENFTKNRLQVIPNPGTLYGEGRPILFYYLEAYNLLSGLKGDKYQTRCWITDAENAHTDLPEMKRTKLKKVNAGVEVGTINISSLPAGIYHLNFAVSEIDGEPIVTRSKKIYIYKTDMVAKRTAQTDISAEFAQSEFSVLDSVQIFQEFDRVKYLLNDEGQKFFLGQNLAARKQFIFRFWKSKDPTPETRVNEYRKDYLERLDYANQQFRRLGREGWRTDRGRVILIYGRPSFVDRFPSSSQSYPYEIWTFDNIEGGVEFVFVDASGIREYILVHSTVTSELQNYNWYSERAIPLR